LAAFPACKKPDQQGPDPGPSLIRRTIDAPVAGISGMTRDEAEVLWLAPERNRVLVAVEPSGAVRTVALEGIPDGVDVESIACLGDGRFALGTESNVVASGSETRASGQIYLAHLEGERAVVTEPLEIDVHMWGGMLLRENQGVEGLCRAGGFLVAAIETVIERDGQRVAPIGLYDLGRKRWQPLLLRLTTMTGKVSAVACRLREAALDVVAVERHFGVLRLLRFRLRDGDDLLTPRIVADLDAFVAVDALNFEGIEFGDDGALVMAVDNQYTRITGPNELVTIEDVAP
jgi:hypothetical protein